MIDVNDLRKGVSFELDGEIYKVIEYQHTKVARGAATIRVKLRNLRSGVVRLYDGVTQGVSRSFP